MCTIASVTSGRLTASSLKWCTRGDRSALLSCICLVTNYGICAVRGHSLNNLMSLLTYGPVDGLAINWRELTWNCCGVFVQCVVRESCASAETLDGFAWARNGRTLGMYVSSVVILMWCTSVSYLVVSDWSVNEFRLVLDRLSMLCDWWLCGTVFHSVASVVAARDMLVRELRPDVGSGWGWTNVHDMSVMSWCAFWYLRCPPLEISWVCWLLSWNISLLVPPWSLALKCGSWGWFSMW